MSDLLPADHPYNVVVEMMNEQRDRENAERLQAWVDEPLTPLAEQRVGWAQDAPDADPIRLEDALVEAMEARGLGPRHLPPDRFEAWAARRARAAGLFLRGELEAPPGWRPLTALDIRNLSRAREGADLLRDIMVSHRNRTHRRERSGWTRCPGGCIGELRLTPDELRAQAYYGADAAGLVAALDWLVGRGQLVTIEDGGLVVRG